LSNFALSSFRLPDAFTGEAREYRTVEHYFQASKATTAGDHTWVAEQPTPRQAKRAGRAIRLRSDWETVKCEVMLTGLRAKFALPRFRAALLATDDRPILEDSKFDFEWGARDARGGWEGGNLLGLALRRVREEVRTGAPRAGDQMLLL